MATIQNLKTQAAQIKNATAIGENTAERVGGAISDAAEIIEGNIEQLKALNEAVAPSGVSVYSIAGYIKASDGTFVGDGSTSWHSTNFISVSAGDIVSYSGLNSKYSLSVAAYDKNKSFLSDKSVEGDISASGTYTVSGDVAYVRSSCYNPNENPVFKVGSKSKIDYIGDRVTSLEEQTDATEKELADAKTSYDKSIAELKKDNNRFGVELEFGDISGTSGAIDGGSSKTTARTASFIATPNTFLSVADGYVLKNLFKYDRDTLAFNGFEALNNATSVLMKGDSNNVYKLTIGKTSGGEIVESEFNSIVNQHNIGQQYFNLCAEPLAVLNDFVNRKKYLSGNDALISNKDWDVTDYIKLNEKALYIYTNIACFFDAYSFFYDADKNVIEKFKTKSDSWSIVKIPTGSKYVRFCNSSKNSPYPFATYFYGIDEIQKQVENLKYALTNTEHIAATGFSEMVNPQNGSTNNFYRCIYKKDVSNIVLISAGVYGSNTDQTVFCAFDENGILLEDSIIYATGIAQQLNIRVQSGWKYVSLAWVNSGAIPIAEYLYADFLSVKGGGGIADEFITKFEIKKGLFTIEQEYLDKHGTTHSNGNWNCTEKIPVEGYNSLYLQSILIANLAYGVFYNSKGGVMSSFQSSGKTLLPIPDGAVSVQLTNSMSDVPEPKAYLLGGKLFENTTANRLANVKYKSVVRRPFTFSGKKAIFVGDSITYGFTTGSTTVHNIGDYPKLFSDAVGMSYKNNAVGGAVMTDGVNGTKSITKQVQEADKDIDYLFIAGGINDWQTDVDYDTFRQTIIDMCTYINENFASSVQVIWITPINNGGRPYSNPSRDVQVYRNVMTSEILANDTLHRFSIIQGNEAPFPSEYDNETVAADALFGDALHPSALGYHWYATFLKTKLC